LGPETKLNTHNFEIQVPNGNPFAKGFEIFIKGQISWL
jgi:hypothetical protein